MPDAAQCAAPTQARRHYLNVNCATNVRKHLIVTIPTASATLCDDELSDNLAENHYLIAVLRSNCWVGTWIRPLGFLLMTL